MSNQQPFQYPLGGGALEIPVETAKVLRVLTSSAEYQALRQVLEGMNAASTRVCRDPKADLDTIRVAQGRIEALSELTTILEHELDRWWSEGMSNNHDEE